MKPVILCNDNTREIGAMPDGSVDLVVMDPPYGTNYTSGHRSKTELFGAGPAGGYIDCDTEKCILPRFDSLLDDLHRVMKPDSHVYTFVKWNKIHEFLPMIAGRFNVQNVLVWKKNNWSMGDLKKSYANQYEAIIYAQKGKRDLNCLDGKCRHADILEFDRVAGKKQVHAHQKPEDLISFIIKKSSNPGDVVLDPYAGSGTTCVAATKLGRKSVCIEANKKACKIMEERLR